MTNNPEKIARPAQGRARRGLRPARSRAADRRECPLSRVEARSRRSYHRFRRAGGLRSHPRLRAPRVPGPRPPWPAIFALFLGVLGGPVSGPGSPAHVTIPWDAKAHFYPQLQFLAQSIHRGEWPFWAPYIFSGSPQIADPQSLIFSPPFLALAAFDPDPGFQAFDGVVLGMLGLGGAFLILHFRDRGWHPAGAFAAAIAFAFGGSRRMAPAACRPDSEPRFLADRLISSCGGRSSAAPCSQGSSPGSSPASWRSDATRSPISGCGS